MGRMINVFDLSARMGGTKLLTDKAHRDGSPSRRNRNDVVKKPVDSGVAHPEDKQVSKMTSELRKSSSAKKSGGTPMKMLIAQEMSNEAESKRKQTNVVARLMGLDEALPARQSVPKGEGRTDRSGRSSRVTLAGALQNSWQQEDGYLEMSLPHKVHSCVREKEYRDIYEVWQQSPRTGHFKDQPLQKGRYVETQNDRRVALVHQKFMEAKRLATDEKLLQSKEFQDALVVLSSNRDLFLKFLEEPNCLFSKHLNELHSTPAASQTKTITLLKPSRTVETRDDTLVKKQQYPVTTEGGWHLDKPQRSSGTTQPTRIVVLKPSPGKRHDAKPMSNISSPELTEKDDFDQVLETLESIGSREMAKDITQQMRESVSSSNRRDESLLSSVLSNGYVGDESSFNRSENDYRGEEDGTFSDSEILSPTSRHSWDFSNRYGSPYSFSSFSRASCSPEPSMVREAKKQLSERWSMVASNGNSREQMEQRRSSSTLGEMLALPVVKKEEVKVWGLTISSSRSYGGEEDSRVSSAILSTSQTKGGDGVERSPGNLSRSRSLPVSSAFEDIRLNSEDSNSQVKMPIVAKDAAKSKSGRSSFKGKVSSLFFSKNKKGGRNKSTSSPLVGSENVGKSRSGEPVEKENDDNSNRPESCPPVDYKEESIKESSATVKGASKRGALSLRDVLSLEKLSASESLSDNQNNPCTSNKIGENQNQPSPTSVLDAPFENDTSSSAPSSAESSNAVHSLAPIESVARTLSWDGTNPEISSPDTPNIPVTLLKASAEDQQRHLFVQRILSTAGLDNGKLNVVFGWHSVHSPLDPILLDKFLDREEEDGKSRERRSNQRLLFDCVNSALLEIGRTAYSGAYPWARACSVSRKKDLAGAFTGDEVQELVSDWFSGEGKLEPYEIDNGGLVVDRLLRREVGGNGWAESMQTEIDEISKEIGGKVLDELVREALADPTVRCLS